MPPRKKSTRKRTVAMTAAPTDEASPSSGGMPSMFGWPQPPSASLSSPTATATPVVFQRPRAAWPVAAAVRPPIVSSQAFVPTAWQSLALGLPGEYGAPLAERAPYLGATGGAAAVSAPNPAQRFHPEERAVSPDSTTAIDVSDEDDDEKMESAWERAARSTMAFSNLPFVDDTVRSKSTRRATGGVIPSSAPSPETLPDNQCVLRVIVAQASLTLVCDAPTKLLFSSKFVDLLEAFFLRQFFADNRIPPISSKSYTIVWGVSWQLLENQAWVRLHWPPVDEACGVLQGAVGEFLTSITTKLPDYKGGVDDAPSYALKDLDRSTRIYALPQTIVSETTAAKCFKSFVDQVYAFKEENGLSLASTVVHEEKESPATYRGLGTFKAPGHSVAPSHASDLSSAASLTSTDRVAKGAPGR